MGILPRKTLTALVALCSVTLGLIPASAAFAAGPAQVIAVAPSDSPATIIANAANVVPSPRQLAWQRLEKTAFLHFGVNTFDGREWGTGSEDPNIFQPTGLNTDQWATSLKNGGFKMGILTAKHHDGFLLFPSKYSNFGVASSSWAGGTGDVVKSFADSMHNAGLKVGIYLSPADLHENNAGGRFANGSAKKAVTIPSDSSEIVNGVTFNFNSDDYNTYFENTLYELLTRYGAVDEVWWDGANPTYREQPYDFTNWISMVRRLQPNAVVENDGGPDVRWVGNEGGYSRSSEWSALPLNGNPATAGDAIIDPAGGAGAGDVASDAMLSKRKADGTSAWDLLRWSPPECNTTLSATHKWFWQPDDTLRTDADLENLYYGSVGNNCNQLLDIGPNRQGLFDQAAVDALARTHNTIATTFGTNLAAGATVANDSGTSNTSGHTPNLALDGNLDTSWQATGNTSALVYTLPSTQTFDVVSVQEDLRIGQRVSSFAVDSWNGSAWTQIADSTTIGSKRLLRLGSSVTTNRVRLRITGSRAAATVAEFGLFRRPGTTSDAGPIKSGLAGKCIDVNSLSPVNGTKVQLWDCNNGANQQWVVQSDGTVRNAGKCLDLYNGFGNGALLDVWDCNGGANQQWRPGANKALINPTSGRCIDVPGLTTTNGTQLQVWDCNAGANQQWALPIRLGPVTGFAGLCVDVRGGTPADGTPVQLSGCNNGAGQSWRVQGDSTIQALGKCLDISGANTTNNTPIQLWTCNGGANQKWTPMGNGTLASVQSGRCLDYPSSSTTGGTQLVIWDCNGGANQKWNLP